MKLYFHRHDGQAVTCDDFLAAMADANDINLDRFGRWYSQSGTPQVEVTDHYDAANQRYRLTLKQHTHATAHQSEKQALVLPFALGLLTADGEELPIQLEGEVQGTPGTRMLVVEAEQQVFTFINVDSAPVPSLFRNYSAPVKILYPYSATQLATLIEHDSDAFVRWDAAQRMATNAILEQCLQHAAGKAMKLDSSLVKAFTGILSDQQADPALLAEALTLPDEDYLAEQMDVVDVDGIHAARRFIKKGLAGELEALCAARYNSLSDGQAYQKAPAAMARRSLKNICLSYLLDTPAGAALASAQLDASDNMTDTLAAIRGLIMIDSPLAEAALAEFETRWQDDALVMDKWFIMQAIRPGREAVHTVRKLMDHPAFSIRNPNKVRALLGVFSMLNPTGFHAVDGSGYVFHADRVLELDRLNPQMAAKMAAAFSRWNRYDENRKARMKAALQQIASADGLSSDVTEIVKNALKQ